MKSNIFTGVAASLALSLASCAQAPQQLAQAPRNLHATAITAPGVLVSEAGAFESYMRKARTIDADFAGPGEVSQALRTGASHEPGQLQAGMVAYAALAALQEPRFVAALKAASGREDLARRLTADPAAALALPGGEAAAARASGALLAQGAALREQGLRVKRAAYSVQHQAWSKTPVADPAGRLARVKRLSAERRAGESPAEGRLYAAIGEAGRQGGPPGPAATRGVALAALSVLGQEGRGRALMSEPRTSSCLRLAKLNLYQCLASAGPQYEDIFCLGQHAMADAGQCVVEAAARPARRATAISSRR